MDWKPPDILHPYDLENVKSLLQDSERQRIFQWGFADFLFFGRKGLQNHNISTNNAIMLLLTQMTHIVVK